MSASSETASLHLPLFEDDDKPSWLGDFNGAMNKIDAGHAALVGLVNTLQTELNAANARITALAAATGHVGI